MAHAEVEYVWPRDGRIRVTGRLHPRRPGAGDAPWWLLLVRRDRSDEQIRRDASLDGPAFEASVAVEDLALSESPGRPDTPDPSGAEPVKWDLYLTTEDGEEPTRLRVGRLLDDIRGKKNIMVFPAQYAESGEGPLAVRPFYTIKDNLSVECFPAPAGVGGRNRGEGHKRGQR